MCMILLYFFLADEDHSFVFSYLSNPWDVPHISQTVISSTVNIDYVDLRVRYLIFIAVIYMLIRVTASAPRSAQRLDYSRNM